MELHHKKHHQAYVTNFNAALEKLAAAEVSESLSSDGGRMCWECDRVTHVPTLPLRALAPTHNEPFSHHHKQTHRPRATSRP